MDKESEGFSWPLRGAKCCLFARASEITSLLLSKYTPLEKEGESIMVKVQKKKRNDLATESHVPECQSLAP